MKQVTISEELIILSAAFMPFEAKGGIMTPAMVVNLRDRLGKLAKLAHSQEAELAVHRLIEANRRIGDEVAKISAQAIANLENFREDNVVRPDFSGGKKP